MAEIDLTRYNRVAISGTHGIGKTTLATRLHGARNHGTGRCDYIPEVADDLIGATTFDWCRGQGVVNFQKAIYYTHLFYAEQFTRFVADRAVLDNWAYCWYRLKRAHGKEHKEIAWLLNHIAARYCTGVALYDAILYYQIYDRETVSDEQIEIDGIMATVFKLAQRKDVTVIPLFRDNTLRVEDRTVPVWLPHTMRPFPEE
jgi:hypothetical protein